MKNNLKSRAIYITFTVNSHNLKLYRTKKNTLKYLRYMIHYTLKLFLKAADNSLLIN